MMHLLLSLTASDFARYLPPHRLGTVASAVSVIALGVGAIGGLLLMAVVRSGVFRERARVGQRASEGEMELTPGYAVLRGVVESDSTTRPFVSVQIRQFGTEAHTKHGWSHRWTETSREVAVRPFDLVLEKSGTRVHVEPDRRVFVIDGLDKSERNSKVTRTRIAEISGREKVWVTGELDPGTQSRSAHAYRDAAGVGPVLRPPRRGERMLVSTEPLHLRHVARARWFTGWAIGASVAFLVVHGALFRDYHMLTIAADTVIPNHMYVDRYQQYVARRRGAGYETRYAVVGSFVTRDGVEHPLRDEVSAALYHEVISGRITRVPFRVSRLDPRVHQFGATPGIHAWQLLLALLISAVLHLVFWIASAATLPWYERRRVVNTGHGRL